MDIITVENSFLLNQSSVTRSRIFLPKFHVWDSYAAFMHPIEGRIIFLTSVILYKIIRQLDRHLLSFTEALKIFFRDINNYFQ